MLDDYDDIQCEEFYGEPPYDEEDLMDTQVDMPAITDDEDYIDTDDLFDAHGGLTADAYAILAEMDSAGEFI